MYFTFEATSRRGTLILLKASGLPTTVINCRQRMSNSLERQQEIVATTSIPFVRGVSERIKRVCDKVGIKVFFRSGNTLRSMLTKVKPPPDTLNSPGVIYRIPFKNCDRSYIGRTEHQRCCRNLDAQRSAVAQHALDEDHRIDWEGSTVIDKECNWHRRRIKEAMHIKRH